MSIWIRRPSKIVNFPNPARFYYPPMGEPEPSVFANLLNNIWDILRAIGVVILFIAALCVLPVIAVLLNNWIPNSGTAFLIGIFVIIILFKSIR